MKKKIIRALLFLIILLCSAPVVAKESPCAEITDLMQKKVVKSIQMNSEIYDMVKSWLINMDNYCSKLSPAEAEGYKVRIPLDPPVKVNKQSLNGEFSEVYIVVPQGKPPFFLIYDNKNMPSYLKFNGNIESLSKALDFKLRD
jgi:hypothetical protein